MCKCLIVYVCVCVLLQAAYLVFANVIICERWKDTSVVVEVMWKIFVVL